MRNMLSKLLLAPVVMAAAALVTIPAMAQSTKIAKVPFKFVVNGHMCPAGRYAITGNGEAGLVELSSATRPIHYYWNIAPGDPSPSDTRVLLTFDVDKGLHTLHTVQYESKITSPIDSRRLSLPYGSSLIVPGQ